MPIYEYECLNCGEKFEKFCRLNQTKDDEEKITCPHCGAENPQRVYSTFGTPTSCGQPETKRSFG
jgi:putative FmdB family regulatory protein